MNLIKPPGKRDQTKTLAEIKVHLEQTGYFDGLPPEGTIPIRP